MTPQEAVAEFIELGIALRGTGKGAAGISDIAAAEGIDYNATVEALEECFPGIRSDAAQREAIMAGLLAGLRSRRPGRHLTAF